MSTPSIHARQKRLVHDSLSGLCTGTTSSSDIFGDDCLWHGSHPLNVVSGIDSIQKIYTDLLTSFPDIERRDLIIIGGHYESSDFVALCGHYVGTFSSDWLGIPAISRPISFRYGEVHEVLDDRIIRSYCLWDILDLLRQCGICPLPPSRGSPDIWDSPFHPGVLFKESDPELSARNLSDTLAMQQTLGDYNVMTRDELLSMPQRDYWHDRMMWYGPCGIGTTRGLAGFVDHHQLPFRLTFPERDGGNHYIRVGDGNFSVTGGWPSVITRHTGSELFGVPATNKKIEMRVMDFYCHDSGRIRENWVPIDVIDILHQMGIDIMGNL